MDLKLTMLKELEGKRGNGKNPEHLFAVGYSACFVGAMRVVGQREESPFRLTSLSIEA